MEQPRMARKLCSPDVFSSATDGQFRGGKKTFTRFPPKKKFSRSKFFLPTRKVVGCQGFYLFAGSQSTNLWFTSHHTRLWCCLITFPRRLTLDVHGQKKTFLGFKLWNFFSFLSSESCNHNEQMSEAEKGGYTQKFCCLVDFEEWEICEGWLSGFIWWWNVDQLLLATLTKSSKPGSAINNKSFSTDSTSPVSAGLSTHRTPSTGLAHPNQNCVNVSRTKLMKKKNSILWSIKMNWATFEW